MANTTPTATQVTLTTTAGAIVAARPARRKLTITNHGTNPFYVGGVGVTAAAGMLVPGTVGAKVELVTQGAVYGITSSSTSVIGILEEF